MALRALPRKNPLSGVQQPYKRDSVLSVTEKLLSFIWDRHHYRPLTVYPPGFGRAALPDKSGPGIFDLSTHKVFPTGMSPYRCVSSYLAISPLSCRITSDVTRRYLFCGTICPRGVQPQSLPVRKYGALCCPDFPPCQ
jgi:hypothetical protein